MNPARPDPNGTGPIGYLLYIRASAGINPWNGWRNSRSALGRKAKRKFRSMLFLSTLHRPPVKAICQRFARARPVPPFRFFPQIHSSYIPLLVPDGSPMHVRRRSLSQRTMDDQSNMHGMLPAMQAGICTLPTLRLLVHAQIWADQG